MQDTLVSSIRHWENQSWIKLWRWPMVANVAAMRNWPTHQNTSAISALGMNTTTTLGQTIGNPSSFPLQQTGCWYLAYPLRFSMMVMNKTQNNYIWPRRKGKRSYGFFQPQIIMASWLCLKYLFVDSNWKSQEALIVLGLVFFSSARLGDYTKREMKNHIKSNFIKVTMNCLV